MLVEAQHETIDQLREVNEQLREHRRMLERSHDIHLQLTSAVIAGADFHAVAQTLAGLIGRGVLVTDAGGRPICTSEDPPPDPALHAAASDALVGRIRIGAELLGHVVVEEGDPASRDLDVRAVEHAATVLALEIVKERVARTTEERLRSDFLSDLLDGRDTAGERIGERARHYGLSLGAEHRVVVVALEDWDAHQIRARLSEAGGRTRRAQILGLVAAALAERVPGALTSRSGDTMTAAVPTGGAADALARVGEAVAAARARVAEVAPGLRVSAASAPRPGRRPTSARRTLPRSAASTSSGGSAARATRSPPTISDPWPVRRQRPPGGARGARAAGARSGAGPRRADRQRAAGHARELPRGGVRRARVRARPLRPRQHGPLSPAPGAGPLRPRPPRPAGPPAGDDGAPHRAPARRARNGQLTACPWRETERVLIFPGWGTPVPRF